MQSILRAIYPPQCLLCDALVEDEGGLCGPCWRETPFLSGLVCTLCGAPLPGEEAGAGARCDDCMALARPWERGRAALAYRDAGRRLVLALKHGDRLDLARPAARWMLRAGAPLLRPGQVVVPVPAHWLRRVRRRYNQAALLALEVSRQAGLSAAPRALLRGRATPVQDGMGREARFANLDGAIAAHPRHGAVLAGADVLLVDDVMTSGATLAAATGAALAAGADRVSVLALARVVKDA